MPFDDTHFTESSDAARAVFCPGCLRAFSLTAADSLCPTCGANVRSVGPAEVTSLPALLERISSAFQAREGEDAPTVGPAQGPAGPDDLASLLAQLHAGGDDAAALQAGLEGADAQPAAAAAIAALATLVVRDPKADIPQAATVRVSGGGGPTLELLATPASFGPSLPTTSSAASGSLVCALPADGSTAFTNAAACASTLVLVTRGGVSFASKALRAQSAGAAAVIVQNAQGAAWPYTMQDSAREAEAGGLRIPTAMVRWEDGETLRARARQGASASLSCAPSAHECAVCMDAWEGCTQARPQGEEATVLPCRHIFHKACIAAWFTRRHTCPLCRSPLPVEEGAGPMAAMLAQARAGAAAERQRTAMTTSWYA